MNDDDDGKKVIGLFDFFYDKNDNNNENNNNKWLTENISQLSDSLFLFCNQIVWNAGYMFVEKKYI